MSTHNTVTPNEKNANDDVNKISQHFTQFLHPEVALTQQQKDEVYKIRHQVYCEELSLEKTNLAHKEQDEFDKRALFAMIQLKKSNDPMYTGCVRAVTSASTNELLPIEKFCIDAIEHETLHPRNFKREEISEISRLAVKEDFRRRKTDQYTGSGVGVISEPLYSETELRCFPFIAIGLYMSAAILSFETGIKHCYVMMEPRLARSMRFVGIEFTKLGKTIEYHGQRAPYYITPDGFRNGLSPEFRSLYNEIDKTLSKQLLSIKKK